jgi:hypothetical protein
MLHYDGGLRGLRGEIWAFNVNVRFLQFAHTMRAGSLSNFRGGWLYSTWS